MKKKFLIVSIIIFFAISFSCQKGSPTIEVNCSECLNFEPDSAELEVNLTISDEYDSVAYLRFFKGNVESGQISWEGNVYTPLFYHLVPVDEYYSVEATYKNKAGKTIIAIDGDKMVSRYIADACDTECWIIKGGLLNVRLKY